MSFNLTKFLKGLLISESGTNTPREIEIIPGGDVNTKTTITSSQTINQTITLPNATDTLIGRNTTDTLTNKTFTSPVLTNAEMNILLSAEQGTTPVSPAAGYRKFYAKSGGFYDLNSAGVETLLGSGGGGSGANTALSNLINPTSINQILNLNNNKIQGLGTPTLATDAATKAYVDGAGSGANTALSNLVALNGVNVDLLPNGSITGPSLGGISRRWNQIWSSGIIVTNSKLQIVGGLDIIGNTISSSGGSSPLNLHSIETGNAPILIDTGMSSSAVNSGDISMITGNKTSGAGNSGSVIIQTGTSVGIRGKIVLDALEIDVSSKKITNLATPTLGTDAANKTYVDSIVSSGVNIVRSGGSGVFNTSVAVTEVDIPNLTVTITTTGGTVRLSVEAFGTGTAFTVESVTSSPTITRAVGSLSFARNNIIKNTAQFGTSIRSSTSSNDQLLHIVHPSSFNYTDANIDGTLPSGTYTYNVKVRNVPTTGTSSNISIFNIMLIAQELK